MDFSTTQDKFVIFGNNPHRVLRRLAERKGRAWNGENDISVKLGLVLDGGGMRSIIAGGMLVAFHELGLRNLFDYVYGCSAGSIAGAYFLSGQSPYGISIYYEDINNSDFITFKFGIPFFDIDYLMDVVKNKKVLDVEAVKRNPTKLILSSTEIESGELRFFSNQDDVDFLSVLKASCALPLYYDKPVEVGGAYYLDGAMGGLYPIIMKAIADGCTDILVLLNKPKYHRDFLKLPMWFHVWQVKWYLTKFRKITYNSHDTFDQLLPLIEGRDPASACVNIAAIAPVKKQLHIATRDTQKLKRAYQRSYAYGHELMQTILYDHSQLHLQQSLPLSTLYSVSF